MLPYIIAGAIGYVVAKLLEDDKTPKYADGGLIAPNGKSTDIRFMAGGYTKKIKNEKYNVFREEYFKHLIAGQLGNIKSFSEKNGNKNINNLAIKLSLLHQQQKAYLQGGNIINELYLLAKKIDENTGLKTSKGITYNAIIKRDIYFLKETHDKIDEEVIPIFNENNPDIRYNDGGELNSGAFKKWFGNSKVVDKKGNPLKVYHGSPDLRGLKEKYIFESRFADNQSFFFTDNYSMAKSYADPKNAFDYQNAEEGVIGLYLSLQNPLIVNAFNQIWRKFETTIDGNEIIGTRNLIKFAKNKGYDGVIVENVRDYYNNNEKKTKGGNVYVAFEPTQIKLADGTNTTFDGENADIRFMAGGQVLNLNKIRKGQYEAKSDEIEISLSNPKIANGFGTNKWQLVIIYGNDSVISEWFNTKNEALKTGAIILNDFLNSFE